MINPLMSFFIPIDPISSNNMYHHRGRISFLVDEARLYKYEIEYMMNRSGLDHRLPVDSKLALDILIGLDYKTLADSSGVYRKVDATNFIKPIEDSVSNVTGVDDRYNIAVRAIKYPEPQPYSFILISVYYYSDIEDGVFPKVEYPAFNIERLSRPHIFQRFMSYYILRGKSGYWIREAVTHRFDGVLDYGVIKMFEDRDVLFHIPKGRCLVIDIKNTDVVGGIVTLKKRRKNNSTTCDYVFAKTGRKLYCLRYPIEEPHGDVFGVLYSPSNVDEILPRVSPTGAV